MGLPATTFSKTQLALIRRTVAKDCDDLEFDHFIECAKALRLNPLQRQIYAFVYNKNDASKRQLTLVTSIQGLRAIADRTGTYRPDIEAPRITYGERDEKTNPLGIVRAEVTVFKFAHGEWFPVVGEAYWDEFVPLYNGQIDSKKTGWVKMPRLMISKVAEANALRKGWPDDFAGLYEQSEIDRGEVLDLSASEMVEQAERDERLAKIGGSQAIMVDWLDGKMLDRVPLGQFADRCLAFLKDNEDAPMTVAAWRDRNRHALREFWAVQKHDALEIKKEAERILKAAEQVQPALHLEAAHAA